MSYELTVQDSFVSLNQGYSGFTLTLSIDHSKVLFNNKPFAELNFQIVGKSISYAPVNQPIQLIVYKCAINCSICASFDLQKQIGICSNCEPDFILNENAC